MAVTIDGTTGVSLVQDGVVATADLADNAVTSAKLFSGFANGITDLDMYRLNATVGPFTTNTETDITTNWERCDDATFSKIGSGMSQSSGIFTFPSTGVYQVTSTFNVFCTDNNNARYFYNYILASSDSGSNYDKVVGILNSLANVTSSTDFATSTGSAFINVTDASTFRVKFAITTDSGVLTLQADSTQNMTHVTFIRLGDNQ